MNKTAVNIGVCISVWVSVFTSFGYISGNRIAESYSKSVFTFLRNQTCAFWIHTFSKVFFDSSCVPSSHTEVGNELWWHRHCFQGLQSNVWVIFCPFFWWWWWFSVDSLNLSWSSWTGNIFVQCLARLPSWLQASLTWGSEQLSQPEPDANSTSPNKSGDLEPSQQFPYIHYL